MAFTYKDVEKMKKEYEEALLKKPSSFSSDYSSLRDEVLDRIASREDFSYDPLSDEVYNIYRDMYSKEGSRAMKDTIAESAALTGGYSNSYAARAGAEAYNDYLSKSVEIIPELYDLALERYKTSASYDDDLYSYYNELYEKDVDDYNDLWDRYYKEVSERESAYKTAKDSYDSDRKYAAEQAAAKKAAEEAAAKKAAEEAAAKKAAEEAAAKKAAEEAAAKKTAEEAAAKKTASKTSSSSSSNKTSSSSDKTSSSSSSSDKTSSSSVVKTETEAITGFRNSILTKSAYKRSMLPTYYPSYNDYVRKNAQSWYKQGKLTDGELQYIKNMYGLR